MPSERHYLRRLNIRDVRDAILNALPTWRTPCIVAIDGVDGSGKSSLARYLAWQLGMPAIETDIFLVKEAPEGEYVTRADLPLAIASRLDQNRPVIVDEFLSSAPLRVLDSNRTTWCTSREKTTREGVFSKRGSLLTTANTGRRKERDLSFGVLHTSRRRKKAARQGACPTHMA